MWRNLKCLGLAQVSGPLIDRPHGHIGGGMVGKHSGSGSRDIVGLNYLHDLKVLIEVFWYIYLLHTLVFTLVEHD